MKMPCLMKPAYLIIAVVALYSGSAAYAQRMTDRVSDSDLRETDRAHPNRGKLRQRVHAALELTEEQEQELKELRTQLREEIEAIKSGVHDGDLTPEDGRAEYKDALRAHRATRDEILTEEQQALLQRVHRHLEEQKLSRPHDGRGGRGKARRFARLSEALELSDEQKEQWRELLRQQRVAFHELRESGEGVSPEDVRRMRQQHRAAFRSILTLSQLEQLDEIRANWQERHRAQDGAGGDTSDFGFGEQDENTAVEEESWGRVKSQTGD